MLLRDYRILSVALCVTVFCTPASAAPGTDATVSSSGVASLRTAPSRLRVVMALQAVGETPQAALKNLKTKREAAVAKLKALKADEGSLSFDTPRVGNSADANSPVGLLIGRTIVETTPGGIRTYSAPTPALSPNWAPVMPTAPGRGTPVKKLPTLYTARVVLRTEWPLLAEGPERLAAAAAEIREKVRAAKLNEEQEPMNLSAEEQELLEEAKMGMTPTQPHVFPGSPGMSSPDGPEFVYVAKFSDAQRKKALAQAFAKAKAGAADLAEAAGMKLGPIVTLSSEGAYNFNFGRMNYGEDDGLSSLKKLGDNEAVAKNMEDMEFSVVINASFRLLPP